MKWLTNKSIDDNKIKEISSFIDKDLFINRICFMLNMNKETLFTMITEKEIDLLVSSVLVNRGLDNKESIDKLFNDISTSVLSPYDLYNAKLAADVITDYCNIENSFIYIFADYDCDGVNSGYVTTDVLTPLSKGTVIVKYPNRCEGYGLAMDWCDMIIAKHTNKDTGIVDGNILVITVDNGITKYQEVEKLKANGIECIITDHHPSKEGEVPNCIVVDPHNDIKEQGSEYHHLCGCGVAFKVCELVQHNFNIDTMLKYTPYLAIATLADVMPLRDENLAFIQYGLEIINGNECPNGLKAMKELKNIDTLTANDILWTIAPMINACGRMGDTELASKLLFLSNELTPSEIAIQIDTLNETRKKITKKAAQSLLTMNFDEDKVCILVTDKYPAGILGIIAGKIAEQFTKPAIVVSKDKKGFYHGSIRSACGIDMISLLKSLKEKELIESYGGHSEACVCGFDLKDLDKIKEFFNDTITEELHKNPTNTEPTLSIDEVITIDHLNSIVHTIVNLLPCDNRMYKNPTFAITDITIKSHRQFKSGYTEIVFKQGNKTIESSVYGDVATKFFEEILPNLADGKGNVHIAGTIDKRSFFSSKFCKKIYTLNIVDIMIA